MSSICAYFYLVLFLIAKCKHSSVNMKMFSKFVIFFCISATSLAEYEDKRTEEVITVDNTFNCYTDYLKNHGFLESHLKTEPFKGEKYLCEMILATTVDRVYEELYNEFSQNENFKHAAGCIVESLRDSKWSDLDIKEQIYEATDLLTPPEKELKIREIKHLQEKISSNSILTCLSNMEFGELFDLIISNSTQDEEDLVGDYCARKYGVDHNLIDIDEYAINLNPTNMITEYIQCDVVNNKHFDDAEIELRNHLLKDVGATKEKVDCYIGKYHDNHYFNRTLAIALLGELNLTDEQKQREKKKFVDTMVNITRIISEC